MVVTFSLLEIAQFIAELSWAVACFALGFIIFCSIANVLLSHYKDKNYWPKQVFKHRIMNKNKEVFYIILMYFNLALALWLVGCNDFSRWWFLMPFIGFPISGLLITWATRITCLVLWLIGKSIEMYLKLFKMNWF